MFNACFLLKYLKLKTNEGKYKFKINYAITL